MARDLLFFGFLAQVTDASSWKPLSITLEHMHGLIGLDMCSCSPFIAPEVLHAHKGFKVFWFGV